MKWIVVLLFIGCGHEPNPVVDSPEETPAESPLPTAEGMPQMEESWGYQPAYDAGESTADAGSYEDAGSPDAGSQYPWANCDHHQKSQGHGRGLAKHCD